ncbi:hypothetical protein WA026_015965 [Henosepilachna vigintioctopunctata]|uniref:Anillin homology domain-containing protein n=1 Tax=Henosepilachna vigintioctopunctata TaxID=420089 RepID=A0AAW1UAI9_9CUCU
MNRNNGEQKILECTIPIGNSVRRRPFREIFERNSSSNTFRDSSESTNLETTKKTMGSQSKTNEKSGPTILCGTQEKPCITTGIVEEEYKTSEHSMTQISRRKTLDSSQLSTPKKVQGGLCKCIDYELIKSKKNTAKGKFEVNLLVVPADKESSSSKLKKNLYRSKSDLQLFPQVPESRRFSHTKQMRRKKEYAMIKKLSQDLPVLRADKYVTEDVLLQNEKHLLVSTEKVKLYSKNITSSKGYKDFDFNPIVINISKILIALKSENEKIYNNAHFMCLICTDDEIFPTKLVRLIHKKGRKCVKFDDILELRRLNNNFRISVKVYSYQRKLPKLERWGLLKFLPKKTVGYPVQICCENLQSDNTLEEVFLLPVFEQCAEFTISKADFSDSYSCNSFPNTIFDDFGFIKITFPS